MFLELFPLRTVLQVPAFTICRDISHIFDFWTYAISYHQGVINDNKEDIPRRNVKYVCYYYKKPYAHNSH